MGRNKGSIRISPTLKNLITCAALKDPQKPRNALAIELKVLIDGMGQVVPSEETLERMISEARNHPISDLDATWSIAASVKYGLPAEATKDLFDIWRMSLAIGRPISIRQAKWLVHIRQLFYQSISTGNPYSDKVNRNLRLIKISWDYSILERAYRITGEKCFDTVALDGQYFMPEYATALRLGKLPNMDYPQEALAKLEKHGTSLTDPPHSIISVEQAVWENVQTATPLQGQEEDDVYSNIELLSKSADIESAYWLNYLSEGPKWGHLDYLEQKRVRYQLSKWMKNRSGIITRYDSLYSVKMPMPFPLKLIEKVGYQIPKEDLNMWFRWHEINLKNEHVGWKTLPEDVQQRFIHDEQTDDDFILLERADDQLITEHKQREQEFIELVQHQGGKPFGKSRKVEMTFWRSIGDEWIKKHPSYAKYLPEDFKYIYRKLIEKQNLNNKSSDSVEGGTE